MKTVNIIGCCAVLMMAVAPLYGNEKTTPQTNSAGARVFNVLNYGAVGDDKTDNTVAFSACLKAVAASGTDLEKAFVTPPMAAKPSCFWWWFNSLVDKEGITRDLEEFKAKGMGGVMLVCSGNDYGVAEMPRGPLFLSPEWREFYKHAVNECARLGLELGVNFCGGGWCMGGSWIKPEYSSRWYVQSLTNAAGPGKFHGQLPVPGHRDGYEKPYFGNVNHYIPWPKEKADYRDTAVVAFREADDGASEIGPERCKLLAGKSNRKDVSLFTTAAKLREMTLPAWHSLPGDKPIAPAEVIDLTSKLNPDGTLDWDVPPGRWTVQRIGHVVMGCDVRCLLPEGDPTTWLEVDWLNPGAVDEMFANLGEILIKDAGQHVGKTLKFLHTDSFEDGFPNWTGKILEKFKEYRGYDPKPYLPVLAGKIVGSAEVSDRFLYDYRKTVADCMADGNYGHFAKRAAEHGLEIQCEAGGPSWSGSVCMDALKNLGRCGRPMGEFWMGYGLNVSKQTACASHIYGRRTTSTESFTGGGHWTDTPGNRKPNADRAFCDGVNRFLFHTMTCQRPQDGKPGYEYGAGTHFNPNVTWWDQAAGPWLSYVNRCQTILQSGLFVADVLFYYGDWAPNRVDPAPIAGYDYDVCNAEVLLTRLSAKDGRLVLPDGMSYRYLVLPDSKRMPVEVARKIEELVKAGVTIIGPKPESDPGLKDYPKCDQIVKEIANSVWADVDGVTVKERKAGTGRVITGKNIAQVMSDDGLKPDFNCQGSRPADIGFIHRATAESDFYFLANRKANPEKVEASFRIAGRQPELWDPVSGVMRKLPEFSVKDGCTIVPLEFEANGSMFVVFKEKVEEVKTVQGSAVGKRNFAEFKPVQEITGAWEVEFDPKWFYPEVGTARCAVRFDKLVDWTMRPDDAIKYYSGTAVYRKVFDFAEGSVDSEFSTSPEPRTLNPQFRRFLDLGVVKETARVRLNGKDLGVVWCAPWRVEITGAVKEKGNELEIEVVNLWPNRLIGDGKLPPEKRLTKTNVVKYSRGDHKLLVSGLLGPVQILREF